MSQKKLSELAILISIEINMFGKKRHEYKNGKKY